MLYNNLDEAIDGVKHGDIVGVLYMHSNYSSLIEERIEKGKDVDDDILDLSQIKVWMDMSSMIFFL